MTVTAVTPVEPAPAGVPTPPSPSAGDLSASFEDITATLPAGEVGAAIFDGQSVTRYGSWKVGAAWSTIKVPLSIAALRVDPGSAQDQMHQAISQSDNAAADYLWSVLGDPNTAAAAVDSVLREGGDLSTRVQSQQVHPPYSPYGQTDWPTDQAAIFAFQLPCITGAAPVIEQMRTLAGNQQWGLAPFADVAAKGGWGPEPDRGYLVRQLALVTNSSGTFGVSLAAKPADGRFESGKAMLDGIGAWIDQQRNDIVGGRC
ncbi:hypothetical protein ACTWP6_25415 [Mycobacterium sp. 4D054]|uniref:hypothetical protein n=1 Tax=Mycobacterium sp. 4D054 TaxID=3457440 RepID=UPI003FD4D5C8